MNPSLSHDLALKRATHTPVEHKPNFAWADSVTNDTPLLPEIILLAPQGETPFDLAEIAGNVFSWCGEEPVGIDSGIDVHVQIRAHSDPVSARAERVITDAGMTEIVVRPDNPLNAVSPGQTAVLYADTRVLGQFTIARTVAVPVSDPALVE